MPDSTRAQLPSAENRYSPADPGAPSSTIPPIQNRPAGSTVPSL